MKNRFALSCFRPYGIETEDSDIAVSNEKKNEKKIIPRRRSCSRKALSPPSLKSLLLGTSPGIRVGDGKIRQITFLQGNESTNMINKGSNDDVNDQQVNSSSSSSSTNSTTCSTTSSSSTESEDDPKIVKKRTFSRSRSNSFDQKKRPKTNPKNNTYCSKQDLDFFALYLIILTLIARILLGKVLAIIFISLFLYIIPKAMNSSYKAMGKEKTSKEEKEENHNGRTAFFM